MFQCFGRTPLHTTVMRNHIPTTRTLLYHGADLNLPDNQGWIPVRTALEMNIEDMVLFLLKHGPNYGLCVKEPDHQGKTILYANNKCRDVVQITDIIVELGCDVNHKNFASKMALHEAIERNNVPLVTSLLRNKCDVNAMYEDNSPLQMCIPNKSVALIHLLLCHGGDLWAVSPKTHKSLLTRALQYGDDAIVSLLVECGAPCSTNRTYTRAKCNYEDKTLEVVNNVELVAVPRLQSQCRSSLWKHVYKQKLLPNVYERTHCLPKQLVQYIYYKDCFAK